MSSTLDLRKYLREERMAALQRALDAKDVTPLKLDGFRCPQCSGEILRAFEHEGEQAFECVTCGHWGTLAWGFQQGQATASSERDAKTPARDSREGDSKPTAESPLDRVRGLLRYERQLGHRYIENTLTIEDLRAIARDAARYQVLTLLAEACMVTVERYEPDGDDADPRVSERSMHRVQHDLLSADDVDAFCDARIAERRS
jgi:Zn ribbon nucleic-acid-binding protein